MVCVLRIYYFLEGNDMTISDLVARLGRLQKEIGNVAQIKIGKEYNETAPAFDYFTIVVEGKDIVLVPSDVWERK